MKITALAENTSVCEEIGAEHGLSLYIETERHHILFDMGQTELFAQNAAKLGVDLAAVDVAILSHGHYDHGGGLRRFLELNDHAPVYLNRRAFEPHYNGEKYIGLDVSLSDSDRLIPVDEILSIDDELSLYSCNDRPKPHNFGSFGLNMIRGGEAVPDDFSHEQYLLIEEDGKRVLISGCSHKGILNIAEWFRPDALIGGFHFIKLSPGDELMHYAQELDRYDTDYYTCHCTGMEQFAFMQPYLGRLHYLSAGQTVEV